jgi:hypothetical protein
VGSFLQFFAEPRQAGQERAEVAGGRTKKPQKTVQSGRGGSAAGATCENFALASEAINLQ